MKCGLWYLLDFGTYSWACNSNSTCPNYMFDICIWNFFMCRIDLCGQIGVWAQKWPPSHFMKMRSLKSPLGVDSPTRGYTWYHHVRLKTTLKTTMMKCLRYPRIYVATRYGEHVMQLLIFSGDIYGNIFKKLHNYNLNWIF